MRWHNHSRFGVAFGDLAIDTVLVVRAVGGERGDRTVDLIKKVPTCMPSSTSLVVSAAATMWPVPASTPMCSLRHDQRLLAPCFSSNHSPAPERFRPVLSTNRCKGSAMHDGQCLGSPADRRMVRNGEIETEQADDGSDQSFRLPQR
jgi:hypothetical protein